jgi:cytochrome c biogenesis protein CcmG/thiol:disulfide interchange protein DsbE
MGENGSYGEALETPIHIHVARKEPMNRWLKVGLLVVTAVVVTQLLVQRSAPPSGTGGRAPPLTLPDLSGRNLDLSKLRGKVVAVNFWATWCSPCRDEIPELARFWTEQRGRCFELVGVAEESAREDVAKVAASIPYPVVLDERAEALAPWGVQGYPVTFVVDAEGHVRQVFTGGISRAELEGAVKPLLPATCPAS